MAIYTKDDTWKLIISLILAEFIRIQDRVQEHLRNRTPCVMRLDQRNVRIMGFHIFHQFSGSLQIKPAHKLATILACSFFQNKVDRHLVRSYFHFSFLTRNCRTPAYVIDTCPGYLLVSAGLHHLTFGNDEIHFGQAHGNHIICTNLRIGGQASGFQTCIFVLQQGREVNVKVGTLADTSIGCIGIIDIDDCVWQVTFVGHLLFGEKQRCFSRLNNLTNHRGRFSK